MAENKRFFTTGDIARMIGVTNPTIRSYIEKGIIVPDIKMPSGRIKFTKETVDKFIDSLRAD